MQRNTKLHRVQLPGNYWGPIAERQARQCTVSPLPGAPEGSKKLLFLEPTEVVWCESHYQLLVCDSAGDKCSADLMQQATEAQVEELSGLMPEVCTAYASCRFTHLKLIIRSHTTCRLLLNAATGNGTKVTWLPTLLLTCQATLYAMTRLHQIPCLVQRQALTYADQAYQDASLWHANSRVSRVYL